MKRINLFAMLTVLSESLFAAPETYVIDSAHTLPRFSYDHFGYSTQSSIFEKVSGKIVLDRQAKTGTVEVVVDTRTVSTGHSLFDQHIKGEDFLDTGKHPSMTFSSSQLTFAGDKLVAVDGTLTLKGISKPVTLNVTSFQCMPHPMLKKDACGANATATLKRSDFNMGKYAPNVGDEVTVTLPVEAYRE